MYSALPGNCSVSFVHGRSLWAELNGAAGKITFTGRQIYNILPLFSIMTLWVIYLPDANDIDRCVLVIKCMSPTVRTAFFRLVHRSYSLAIPIPSSLSSLRTPTHNGLFPKGSLTPNTLSSVIIPRA